MLSNCHRLNRTNNQNLLVRFIALQHVTQHKQPKLVLLENIAFDFSKTTASVLANVYINTKLYIYTFINRIRIRLNVHLDHNSTFVRSPSRYIVSSSRRGLTNKSLSNSHILESTIRLFII